MGLADVVLTGGDDVLDAYRKLLGPSVDGTWSLPNARLRVTAAPQNLVLVGVDDAASATRLLTRRGLELDAVPDGLRARDLPVGITSSSVAPGSAGGDAGIVAVDHLVFFAADRDHAVALFGATLGMDFRLAQSIPGVTDPEQAAAVTQLFFRDGELIIEVVAKSDVPEKISFWGIAWRTEDLELSAQALRDNGFDVSEIRAGRKPGTRVCTVRDRTLAVATLLIEHSRGARR